MISGGSPRLAVLLATTALGLGLGGGVSRPAWSQTVAEARHEFNISGRSARQALNEIGRVSGITILFGEAAGSAAPVQGAMTVAQAVTAALTGSGLSWQFTNANTVTIFGPVAAHPRPAPRATARRSVASRCAMCRRRRAGRPAGQVRSRGSGGGSSWRDPGHRDGLCKINLPRISGGRHSTVSAAAVLAVSGGVAWGKELPKSASCAASGAGGARPAHWTAPPERATIIGKSTRKIRHYAAKRD